MPEVDMKTGTVTASERQARNFLSRLIDAANRKGATDSPVDVTRTALRGRREERYGMVALIEQMVEADDSLRSVGPTVSSLLRTSLAAEELTKSLAGDGTMVDDVEELLTADDVLRIARVRGEAEAGILRHPMLDSSGLARALGSSSSNPREYASRVRARGDVVGLPRANGHVFPAFQVDVTRGRVWPIVVEINHRLDAKEDPWGVASWWLMSSPELGVEPYRLVSDPAREGDLRHAAALALAIVE